MQVAGGDTSRYRCRAFTEERKAEKGKDVSNERKVPGRFKVDKKNDSENWLLESQIHTSAIPFPQTQMCPHLNDGVPSENAQDMVGIEGTPNRLNGRHGVHSNGESSKQQRRNPYAPRASDFLNNVSNFKIIESTLRGSCICRFQHFSPIDITPHRGGAICQCLL